MKVKKIAAQVKARGILILYDHTDAEGVLSQWIGTGAAAYPITGMPYLEPEHLVNMLDLSKKDLDKINVMQRELPEDMPRDAVEGEVMPMEAPFRLLHQGREVLIYQREGDAYFVDRALLGPIWSEYDEAELWLRFRTDGTPYFAVKNGLLVVGLVMPMDMSGMREAFRRVADGSWSCVEE